MDMVGEHAPYDQIEKSVNEAKKNANTTLINYTVVPNFEEQMPYYEIIIETEEKNANKLKIFLKKFDLELQESVCSYARMRKKGDFYRLQAPKMSIVQKGTYDKINKQRIINEPQPKAKHIIGGPA